MTGKVWKKRKNLKINRKGGNFLKSIKAEDLLLYRRKTWQVWNYEENPIPQRNLPRYPGLSLPMNRVCTGQSSECASAKWQSAAVTPQFNVSFSFVSRVSEHLIEFIAIES